ncbi:MAG TPA: hypothetical protein VIA18_32210, partial [Polyangia bacterium]|nr:hypothetical protein [Polyangia bacterium]
GLVTVDTRFDKRALVDLGAVDIDAGDARYHRPLTRDAEALAKQLQAAQDASVVLLGSLASPKYLAVLTTIFGERLHYPRDFVGLGDMSRGSQLLKAARAGVELPYAPVSGLTPQNRKPR